MMLRFHLLSLVLLVPAPVAVCSAEEVAPPSSAFFESRIRPLLVRRCLRCHGSVKSGRGLRLDSRKAVFRGGKSGPAVVEG
ncbi:MAG TPA: hypothetical protein DCE43_11085, partial [Planctomycetaceae bacterium]|nr:hypothetical protein [Planctomycetaceae bacterium]